MRNPNRIEPFLQKLGELWHYLPDYRFGQLIYRLADELGQDIYFPEEDVWLEKIDNLIQKCKEHETKTREVMNIREDELQKLIVDMVNVKDENKYRVK